MKTHVNGKEITPDEYNNHLLWLDKGIASIKRRDIYWDERSIKILLSVLDNQECFKYFSLDKPHNMIWP